MGIWVGAGFVVICLVTGIVVLRHAFKGIARDLKGPDEKPTFQPGANGHKPKDDK